MKDRFKNLIYFAGDAVLKTDFPPEVMTQGIFTHIQSHEAELVTPDELTAAVKVIEGFEAQAPEARRHHKRQMRQVAGVQGGR